MERKNLRTETMGTREAASALGVTPRYVRKLLRQGHIHGFQPWPGADWRIPRGMLDVFLKVARIFNGERLADIERETNGNRLN